MAAAAWHAPHHTQRTRSSKHNALLSGFVSRCVRVCSCSVCAAPPRGATNAVLALPSPHRCSDATSPSTRRSRVVPDRIIILLLLLVDRKASRGEHAHTRRSLALTSNTSNRSFRAVFLALESHSVRAPCYRGSSSRGGLRGRMPAYPPHPRLSSWNDVAHCCTPSFCCVACADRLLRCASWEMRDMAVHTHSMYPRLITFALFTKRCFQAMYLAACIRFPAA